MSNQHNSRHEQSSTYFVQDRSNEDERIRVMLQDQLFTTSMGGVLPEQADPENFQHVIDIGCGPGGWLIDVARTYPGIPSLVGIDISNKMIEYACAQATTQQVANRVEFHVADALRTLEFPDHSFDLVNLRMGASFLRKWDWPKIVSEFKRITLPGGVIRSVEATLTESNGPAFTRLAQLFLEALYQAGHYFALNNHGLTDEIAPLLQRYGLRNVQTRIQDVEYRAGTPEGQQHADNMRYAFRTLLPFFRKWIQMPDNYETLYQQMLSEMQQPGFVATLQLVTVWGNRPEV